MKSMNRVFLIGNAGKDPEVRYTGDGTAVASFSLATNKSYKDSSGAWQKQTEWHNIVVWGKSAESVKEHVVKGSPLHIEGEIRTRSWDDKNNPGTKKYITEIHVREWTLLEKVASDAAQQTEPAPAEQPDLPF